jgi:hypothetical protein
MRLRYLEKEFDNPPARSNVADAADRLEPRRRRRACASTSGPSSSPPCCAPSSPSHWNKERGRYPDGSERINDLHYTTAEKRAAKGARV